MLDFCATRTATVTIVMPITISSNPLIAATTAPIIKDSGNWGLSAGDWGDGVIGRCVEGSEATDEISRGELQNYFVIRNAWFQLQYM